MSHHRLALNNYLQEVYGSQSLMTWETVQVGPRHEPIWVAIALIRDIEYGRGSANNVRAAKEEAARQALEALAEEAVRRQLVEL